MFLKKSILSLAVCLLFVWTTMLPVSAKTEDVPDVSAEAAVVYCVNTGQVLYEKNANERLAMASTTKIMTSLLTLEAAAVDNKLVTITQEMVAVEGSSMGLRGGDALRLRELAVGMLMVSGNDAANAAAIAVGGTTEQFAAQMNQRAQELGMTNTHFVTPSGLDDDAHYSTALDMAKLGAAAISNDSFREICRQTSMNATFENPQKTVSLTNHNRLLKMYDGCIGVKTGFTKKAGRCLVSAAERDGVTLVAVTLHAPDDWQDHQVMLDYGFSQVETISLANDDATLTVPVVGGVASAVTVRGVPETDAVVIGQRQDVTRSVQLPRFVYAPVEQGTVLGNITYTVNGEVVATVPLAAVDTVEAVTIKESAWRKIAQWFVTIFA